ncbi:MAG: type II secretion system F family protein [Candidatus Bathyarchaeota archaeon]|nr:type II secretion system F family protein [Candidatus Bathyarchaeota archaeon]
MKSTKAYQKIIQFFNRFKLMFKLPSIKPSETEKPSKRHKFELKETHTIAYQLIGGKIGRLLPLFRDLDLNLQRSGLKVNFRAYVSLTIFVTILTSLFTLALIPTMLFFFLKIPPLPAILFGLGGSLFISAFSIMGFYAYPVYRADKLKRGLEDELPFTTGYMAILTTAGVSPEKIFYSLSNLSEILTVSIEAKNIVRDVRLFGLDIISALEESSKRTSSERFREMLQGLISTIHSGGNLSAHLREKSRQYMKLKRISLRKFSDTLSILSEFYVALIVTGPLLLIIMLAVMEMMGGGFLGMLSSNLLLSLLTYIGIPLGSIMFLIILDAVSPKW